MPFSIKQLDGATVLLTGGLGYLGAVALEQLLRLTEVKRVIMLVRAKRDRTAAERVEQLLSGPLFNMLHAEAAAGTRNVFGKVQAVEGDLTKPGLGLAAADLAMLQASISVVLHCGANIELDADVHMTLKNNYMGTLELMTTAGSFEALRAFVHVSTFFVNNHLPRNSVVREAIYPLPLDVSGVPVTHREYVAAMLAVDADEANRHTLELMARHGFTSTYAFGKHLTEQLVDATPIRAGVSRAIVRPSLIASVAGAPYPGYINSYAGAGGYTMGYALGFFQGVRSLAYGSDTFLDLIPCDTVAALVIAAAAAASATCGSASAGKGAVIFHAASAQCHPLTIGLAFETMGRFWAANPPPLRLPATPYVQVRGHHAPTPRGIAAGRRAAKLKLALVCGALALAGKHRERRALKVGFKAFSVHNSLAYAKSIVCAVDNARALSAQLPAKERAAWPLVFEPAVDDWDHYGNTFMAGVRRLLFRMGGEAGKVRHAFTQRAGVTAEQLRALAQPQQQQSPSAQAPKQEQLEQQLEQQQQQQQLEQQQQQSRQQQQQLAGAAKAAAIILLGGAAPSAPSDKSAAAEDPLAALAAEDDDERPCADDLLKAVVMPARA